MTLADPQQTIVEEQKQIGRFAVEPVRGGNEARVYQNNVQQHEGNNALRDETPKSLIILAEPGRKAGAYCRAGHGFNRSDL